MDLTCYLNMISGYNYTQSCLLVGSVIQHCCRPFQMLLELNSIYFHCGMQYCCASTLCNDDDIIYSPPVVRETLKPLGKNRYWKMH